MQLVSPEVCCLSKTLVAKAANPGRWGNLCLILALYLFWDASVPTSPEISLERSAAGPCGASLGEHVSLCWCLYRFVFELVRLLVPGWGHCTSLFCPLLHLYWLSCQTLHSLWSSLNPLGSSLTLRLYFRSLYFWVCWSFLISELGWSWTGWTSGTDSKRPAVKAWWRTLLTSPHETRTCPYSSFVPISTQYF